MQQTHQDLSNATTVVSENTVNQNGTANHGTMEATNESENAPRIPVENGWMATQFVSTSQHRQPGVARVHSPTRSDASEVPTRGVLEEEEEEEEEDEDLHGWMSWMIYFMLWPWQRHGTHLKGILLNEESKQIKLEARMNARQPVRVHFRLPKKDMWDGFHLLDSHAAVVQRWRMFMVIVIAYEIWAFPFRLAFGASNIAGTILVADGLCDLLFLVDMGVQLSTVIPAGTFSGQEDAVDDVQAIFKTYMRRVFPFEILPCVAYYIVTAQTLRHCEATGAGQWCWIWWAAAVPRMVFRTGRLTRYFRSMESDLKVSVRTLQAVKFSLILFLSAHCVGCLFYWLARLQHLDGNTWVAGFEALLPMFRRDASSVGERYLMCIYRGFNSLSNLQYDVQIHRNPVEMIWSMVVMGFQVYMSALILGTLLNYLVTKDPVTEAHKKRMEELAQFAEAKQLPLELRERLFKYLEFQHRKNVQNKEAASMDLPQNLQIKVADSKYRAVINKCATKNNVLFNCDKHFLNALIVRLKVVHLMPGEEFVAEFGIPRELYFVLEGTVHVIDAENRVVRAISNDVGNENAPICGEVPFFLGVNHHNSLRARQNGDVQLLVLGRAEMDSLFTSYPAEQERIVENILAGFGLDCEGSELESAGKEEVEADRDRVGVRETIVKSIQRRHNERFASLVFAANNGDLETVNTLMRHGQDVNQVNYDGRTILHDACMDGNYRLAEMLLEFGANANVQNRWGHTPLAEAIANKQALIVGLLTQWKARLNPLDAAESLCEAASVGDVEALRRLIENRVNPNLGDYDGRTALHIASAEGHAKIVEFLLSMKANANCKDRWGGTPLQDAVKGGHLGIASTLRAKGGTLPLKSGAEQVCTAASKGDVRQLRLLHECGVPLDVGDYDDRYPLHLAAAEARILAVSYLLSMSTDPNATDRWGGRPLDDALRGGTLYHLYCAKLLAGWGGEQGSGEQIPDKEWRMERLEQIKVLDVRKLIKKLIEAGYDTRQPQKMSDVEIAVAFESTMLHMPLVSDMLTRTQGIKSLLQRNVDHCSEALDTFKATIMRLARDLDRKKAAKNLRRSGSVRTLSRGPLASMSPEATAAEKQAEKPERTLIQQCEGVLCGMDAAELGVEVLNEVDSEDELALYEEIDALVEAKERAEQAGVSAEKISAQSFQKAALRIVEISRTFEALCIIARVAQGHGGGGGLMKVGENGGGVDNSREPWLSMEELGILMELLGADAVNQLELEELFEEGVAFQNEHNRHPPLMDASIEKGLNKVRMLLAGVGAKDGAGPQSLVSISSMLAGSAAFRRALMNLRVDSDLCFLMDTRLSDVISEQDMRQLLPFVPSEVEAGTVLFDAATHSEWADKWYVILSGECEVAAVQRGEGQPRSRVSHLSRGDFFGAYSEITGNNNPPFVIRTKKKCELLELHVSPLLNLIGKSRDKSQTLARLMGEAPAVHTAPPKSTKSRGRRQHKQNWVNKLTQSWKSSLSSRGPDRSAPSNISLNRQVRRASMAKADAVLETGSVSEWEKRAITEMVQHIHRIWSNFAMGSSNFSKQQLRLIHRLLGEVSSECFNKMFLENKLPDVVLANHYWKCWVDFLSEEVFGAAPRDRGKGRARNSDSGPSLAPQDLSEMRSNMRSSFRLLDNDSAVPDNEVGWVERLHARFAPSRSLKGRLFEEDALEQYESAWVYLVGSTVNTLPCDKIPALLGKVFTDFEFRITDRNVAEFLLAIDKDKSETKSLAWPDLHKVIRDRRMGVKEKFDGKWVGSALNPKWAVLARWHVLVGLCAVYYLFMVPVRIAFLPWRSFTQREALCSDLVVDCLVMLDFVVRLNTAYMNRSSHWVTARLKILRRIPLPGVLAALPLDWCAHATGASNELACWLRLPKMLLALALHGPNTVRRNASGRRSKLVPLLQLCALTLHWSACGWFYLGRASDEWASGAGVSWYEVDDLLEDLTYPRDDLYGMQEGSSVWDQYVLSLYWVSATITINGLVGDLIPQNTFEIAFTILLMVLNMTVVRWVLGEVSTIIMSADDQIVKAREELEVVDSFINGNNLPPDLQAEIRSHYHSMHQGASFDQGQIYNMLSHSLQMEVASHVAREYLDGLELFHGCSEQLLDAISVLLREVAFSPEQWLFHEAETSSSMYVMIGGAVEEVIETETECNVENVIRPPGSVGELPFFFGIRHFISSRAYKATGALCLKLDKVNFLSLMKLFPEQEELVAHNAIRIMERVNKHRGTSKAGSSKGRSRHASSRASSMGGYSRVSSKMDASMSSVGRSHSHHSSIKDDESEGPPDEGSFCEDESGDDGDHQTMSSAANSDRSELVLANMGGAPRSSKIMTLKARRKNERVMALLTAAAAGDVAALSLQLDKKADLHVNDTDEMKRTALHVAASEGQSKAVQFLLEHGADPHLRDKQGNTPLDDAVRHRNDPTAKVIRDAVPDIPMSLKGDAAGVEMCKAAHQNNVSRLKRLIVNKANVNESDYDGRTALHLAACEGHVSVVRFLIDHKANVDCIDRFGGTPIQDAVRHGQTEVQAVLYKSGGRLEKGGTDYAGQLCEAAAEGELETIQALAKNGVDLNAGDYDGRTALHLAAANERVSVLEFLLARDPPVNVNPCDRFMCTPLDDAVRHEQETAQAMLKKRGGLRRGDPLLAEQLEDQQRATAKRFRMLREPQVQAALRFSPEQRALHWLREQLEPTIAKTVALVEALLHLVESMRSLIDDDFAMHHHAVANGNGNGNGNGHAHHLHVNGRQSPARRMLDNPPMQERQSAGQTTQGAASPLAVVNHADAVQTFEPEASAAVVPAVIADREALIVDDNNTLATSKDAPELAEIPGVPAGEQHNGGAGRERAASVVGRDRMAYLMTRMRGVLNRTIREDVIKTDVQARVQAAEEVRKQLGDVKQILIEYLTVMDGRGGDEEAPIDCHMWKAASSRYEAEAKELRRVLLHMGGLCRFSRKLVKELIRLEKRSLGGGGRKVGGAFKAVAPPEASLSDLKRQFKKTPQ